MTYYVCGLDEVGRGAFAGPMLAVAAVFDLSIRDEPGWLTKNTPIPGVNDSKKFSSHEKRKEVYHRILKHPKLVDFGIGHVSQEEIDKDGIDYANRTAFYNAWNDLTITPNFMLVDGDRPAPAWSYSNQQNRPRGDGFWWPVGAASILAKVIRDMHMIELGLDYPQYKWSSNSGYGTKDHLEALKAFGSTPVHRQTFVQKHVRNL